MYDPEKTYCWLVEEKIKYHFAIGILIDQVYNEVERYRFSKAIEYLEELKFTGDAIAGELERAQILLECARAAFKINDKDLAICDLRDALEILKQNGDFEATHYNAVALWMLGSLLFETQGERKNAITNWQSSLDKFTLLSFNYYKLASSDWYEDRCVEMRQAIEKAIRGELFTPTKRAGATKKASTSDFKLPLSTLFTGKIRTIDVIGEIPAGGFSSSGIELEPLEIINLEPSMDEFTFGESSYQLFNLRNTGGVITLVSSHKYFLLKVNGNSMDKAGIGLGDYVLLRQQETADNGDIVAAEVVGIDNEATLKRYKLNKNSITLSPDSTTEHKTFTFPLSHNNLRIRGLVLGILKPFQ